MKGNYVGIICFIGMLKAKFVTVYEKDNIESILRGPDFEYRKEFFGGNKT